MRQELRRSRGRANENVEHQVAQVEVEATPISAEPVEAQPIMAEDVIMAVAVPTDYGQGGEVELASQRRGVQASEPSILERVVALEELVHGEVSNGTLRARVEALETELVEEVGTGPMRERVAALEGHLS